MARKTNLLLIVIIASALVFLLVVPHVVSPVETNFIEEAAEGEEAGFEIETVEDLVENPEYYTQYKNQNKSVIVYNWGEYISDGSDDMLDVNKAFTELTGIKVLYLTFSTNEELYAKLKSGNAGYDVIIPSDYMVGKMIEEDMLLPLDFEKLPNYNHIEDQFKTSMYDTEGKYSVPYTWGITGIIYNTALIDDGDVIDSWNVLWDEDYLGEILMFSNSRDAFGVAQKKMGYSLNTEDKNELRNSLEALKEQKPLVQAYVMDEIFDKMIAGEATLAPYYAGDAITMIDDNPDLDFCIPKEGVNIFVDAAAIPKTAPNPEMAHVYMNFLMEPKVAAQNSEYIGYATPNGAAKEYIDPELLESDIMYPPQEDLDNAEYFLSQPRETSLLVDSYWTELLSDDEKYNELLVPIILLVAIIATIAINIYRGKNKRRRQNYSTVKKNHRF